MEVFLNDRGVNVISQDKDFGTVIWKNDYKLFGLLFVLIFFSYRKEYTGDHQETVILILTDSKTRWWQKTTSNSATCLTNLNFPNHKSFNLYLENSSAGGLS